MLTPVIRAVAFAVCASLAFSAMHALVRGLSGEVHAFEIAFFRSLVGVVIAAAVVLRPGSEARLLPHDPLLMLLRGVVGGASMVAWFYGLSQVPLAEATALSFTSAIFASVGAVAFLGESMGVRRWSAVFLGLIGAILILRPGAAAIQVSALIVLASSLAGGVNVCIAKVLLRRDSAETVVLWLAFAMTVMSSVPAALVWTPPSPAALVQLGLIGCLGSAGMYAWTLAMKSAPATVVIPVDYMRLVWAAGLGFFWFGEIPDAWTWSGGLIIVATTLYIGLREARLARRVSARGTSSRRAPS